MADESETPKSNPKPVPKPGQLKPAGSSNKKNNSKDYKSLTGRQKAAIFLISLGPDVSAEIMKHLREDELLKLRDRKRSILNLKMLYLKNSRNS